MSIYYWVGAELYGFKVSVAIHFPQHTQADAFVLFKF